MSSAPWMLHPNSPCTVLSGAFHQLDRKLALDGFIHLLVHKVIPVIIYFFTRNFERWEKKCILKEDSVSAYRKTSTYQWENKNTQVKFWRWTWVDTCRIWYERLCAWERCLVSHFNGCENMPVTFWNKEHWIWISVNVTLHQWNRGLL